MFLIAALGNEFHAAYLYLPSPYASCVCIPMKCPRMSSDISSFIDLRAFCCYREKTLNKYITVQVDNESNIQCAVCGALCYDGFRGVLETLQILLLH